MWLSGLSADLQTKGPLVWFPIRAGAWIVGQVPSWGFERGTHTFMFLSLYFSLPFSKNKYLPTYIHSYIHTYTQIYVYDKGTTKRPRWVRGAEEEKGSKWKCVSKRVENRVQIQNSWMEWDKTRNMYQSEWVRLSCNKKKTKQPTDFKVFKPKGLFSMHGNYSTVWLTF